jgi:uncharacterized protein YunC (DUF1805 family)
MKEVHGTAFTSDFSASSSINVANFLAIDQDGYVTCGTIAEALSEDWSANNHAGKILPVIFLHSDIFNADNNLSLAKKIMSPAEHPRK